MQLLTNTEELTYVRNRGFEPLMLFDVLTIDIDLRRSELRELFPKYSVENNNKFYRWFWENYPKTRRCEECGKELFNYYSWHVSHIVSRGSRPDLIAYDPINVNLLCYIHHQQWEDATKRPKMKIYRSNQSRIEKLSIIYP